jgi:hypothetical protein
MNIVLRMLELGVVVFALASAVLWLQASRQTLRRISRHEELDASDLNQIITQMNRTQILNSRAAMMTALATVLGATRVMFDMILR